MFCTMCTHGVTSVIDGKPTGKVWWCSCGDTHCRHIGHCPNNGKPRRETEISYEEREANQTATPVEGHHDSTEVHAEDET